MVAARPRRAPGPGPFHCVHLTCTAMDAHRGEIARWMQLLAAKGVQELVFLNRPWPLDLRLPAALLSFTALTRLHIGVWGFPDTRAAPSSPTSGSWASPCSSLRTGTSPSCSTGAPAALETLSIEMRLYGPGILAARSMKTSFHDDVYVFVCLCGDRTANLRINLHSCRP
ncbi:hypothetical protein E2562_005607 [Oryza meyeriana var. granulata]|uniref:F-box/LRR-repeat protein 15/At3g58940/PEG3-like LRR domain-containing protein n=1 Tax=Oryza meyeriana var. granulata TaxID=110450 RepID=A0A6G1F4B0_9ORYZ|nr:hypothetical protein E2562_005607 [Oryza meyeriana var. granulata]